MKCEDIRQWPRQSVGMEYEIGRRNNETRGAAARAAARRDKNVGRRLSIDSARALSRTFAQFPRASRRRSDV